MPHISDSATIITSLTDITSNIVTSTEGGPLLPVGVVYTPAGEPYHHIISYFALSSLNVSQLLTAVFDGLFESLSL